MSYRNREIRTMQLEEVIHQAEVFVPVAKDAVQSLDDERYDCTCHNPLYSVARKRAKQLFLVLQAFLDEYGVEP